MEHIGIDVHKRESQICILTPEGEILEQRIPSTRERFATFHNASGVQLQGGQSWTAGPRPSLDQLPSV